MDWNWQKLFSYGEVACFVTAWVVGIMLAVQGQAESRARREASAFASAPDAIGIQANLSR